MMDKKKGDELFEIMEAFFREQLGEAPEEPKSFSELMLHLVSVASPTWQNWKRDNA